MTGDKLTTGRCWTCQRRVRFQGAVVYRWRGRKGRRLYQARCPICKGALEQTCFANLKRPHVKGEPHFMGDSE
jgi:hypothetical protein